MLSDDNAHGRLPWLRPQDLTEDQAEVYRSITQGLRATNGARRQLTSQAGCLEGPFNALLFNPKIGGAVEALGAAVRYRSVLTDRQREIATLEVATALRSEYEWHVHAFLGRQARLSDDELDALRNGKEAESFGPAERAIRRAARSAAEHGDISDAAWGELSNFIGAAGCVDLLVLVGYYWLLALNLRALRVPLPADGKYPPETDDTDGPQ